MKIEEIVRRKEVVGVGGIPFCLTICPPKGKKVKEARWEGSEPRGLGKKARKQKRPRAEGKKKRKKLRQSTSRQT